MAFSSCTLSGLQALTPGALVDASPKQIQALRILYLYRQQFPATIATTLPASTLISQAACFDCGVSDTMLEAFSVIIQRQRAIDAGFAASPTSPPVIPAALGEAMCLTCLPAHQLKAIETMLLCQVS